LLGEGDALNKLGYSKEAIEVYTKIVEDEKFKNDSRILYYLAVERRGMIYFHAKEYDKAKRDFNVLTEQK
jgi:tetratricopeptide (TPR) repeat protein